MEIIPIAPDRSLELEETQWRLVQDQDNGKSLVTLVEADNQQIKFDPTFLTMQPLPLGILPTSSVAKVVAGWMPESQGWQVGMFLAAENGLTWCEVAAWNGDYAPRSEQSAKSAAKALSEIMSSPLQVIERDVPHTAAWSEGENQSTQPAMHTRPLVKVDLQPLPLYMGDWSLKNSAEGLVWQLTSQWTRRQVWRTFFFMVGMLVFFFLGLGSLRSGLAEVTPTWLPLVAFGIAFVLGLTSLEHAWKLLTRQQVVIDDLAQEVRCERALTHLVSWRVPFSEIGYVLVSQEPAHAQGRRSPQDPMQIAQTAWVHLATGQKFYLVAEQEDAQGQSWVWEAVRRRTSSEERLALDLSEYDTPVHHAALHTAQHLGVSIYVDIR